MVRMESAAERLTGFGLVLPVPTPTQFAYLPALRYGSTVHVAGQIPKVSADRLSVQGVLGKDLSDATAQDATRLCILHALSWVCHHAAGDLDAVAQILRVNYFFQVPDDGFHRMSEIADAGSHLLVSLFDERGRHPRSVIGVRELPRNAPVLIDMDVVLRSA